MIRVDGVSKKFHKKRALDNVSVTFGRGIYGLLGPNGAGKTTLLRCITGLVKTDGGEIKIEYTQTGEGCNAAIGYLPQSFGMYRELKLYEMLELIAELKRLPQNGLYDEISRCICEVGLKEYRNEKVKALSGGMVRRAGIAQALLGNPGIMILDEPAAGLDPEERFRFRQMLGRLADSHTVILSTHIVADVGEVCGGIVIMKEGRVRFAGSKEELHAAAEKAVAEKAGAAGAADGAAETAGAAAEKAAGETAGAADGIEAEYLCILEEQK